MKLQEIQNILEIPDSTLSDWDKNPKRKQLMKLLRSLDVETAQTLLDKEDFTPKYSPHTRKIKLDKTLFRQDLLYSREDSSVIDIDNLISIYLKQPNQDDTNTLLYLFGTQRVRKLLEKNKEHMPVEDYEEALEQIEYGLSSRQYQKTHTLPSIEEIIQKPKQRYIDILHQKYSKEEILKMAAGNNTSYPVLFKLKKMLGERA
ncbi:MAG: hypothetical protein QM497_07920 [Sulfurimonas sp.]